MISQATLQRFAVEELEFGRRPPTIPVADSGPGEEVRLDTGRVGSLKKRSGSDRRQHFRAWIFAAVLSRHPFVLPVLSAQGDDRERDPGVRGGVGLLRWHV
jgi:hypothetical protein